jgi:nitrogen fixation NifU-like protein
MAEGQDRRSGACIKNTEIVAELSLPPVKIHCSVLAEDADQGGDCRLQEEAGRGEGREAGRRARATERVGQRGRVRLQPDQRK